MLLNMHFVRYADMKCELACIVCPSSCILTVDKIDDTIHVTGNKCDQGIIFAEKEIHDPERILTTTVKLTTDRLLPVRSNAMVKKHEIKSIVSQLKTVVVKPPVEIGQIIKSGVGENSVDIIATDKSD